MNRSIAVPIPLLVLVVALVLLVAGSAVANGGFSADRRGATAQDEEGGVPSEKQLDKIVERLGDADIATDAETVAGLAENYGVGGAVRLLAWADATGKDPAEIGAMRDSGMGWGEIARQLNEEDAEGDLDLSPGIGWVMGSHGHGHGHADPPGQTKKQH